LPNGVSIGHRAGGRRSSWEVYCGKKYTGGPIVRRKFRSRADAVEWLFGVEGESAGEADKERAKPGSIVGLVQRAGHAVFGLSAAEITEAAAAFRMVKAAKMTLTEAVKIAISRARPAQGAKTLSEAIERMCDVKRTAGKDSKYIAGLGWSLGRFQRDFKNCNLHEVEHEEIEEWLAEQEFSVTTQRGYIRDLYMLYNFALKRGWTSVNPVVGIEKPSEVTAEVVFFRPQQLRKLLDAAAEAEDFEVLVGLAIKSFAGLRTSELLSLDWEQVKKETITVLAADAKTRQRRVVTIQPNLVKWLRDRRHPKGPAIPLSSRAWHDRVNAIAKRAELWPLPQNVLRKGYITYHLAGFRKENVTAYEAGNSPQVIYANYRGLVEDPKEVTAYWAIVPRKPT
jgi:integrase